MPLAPRTVRGPRLPVREDMQRRRGVHRRPAVLAYVVRFRGGGRPGRHSSDLSYDIRTLDGPMSKNFK